MDKARVENDLVKYRYARSAIGDFINIADHQVGQAVFCVECSRPMIPRKGRLKQWHFAHKSDATQTCSPETALHRLSKIFIKEGFEASVAAKRPYNIRWPCFRCNTATTEDCTLWCSEVESEGSPIAGVRSDLLFHGRQPFAVEIVVSHGLEEKTASLYVEKQLPVFIVRPTWESVGALRQELSADSLWFATNSDCNGCQRLDELAKSQDIQAFLARLRERLEKRPRFLESTLNIQRWSMKAEHPGNDLPLDVQRTLREHAKRLVGFGFAPLRRRLILNRHLEGVGNLYASLRGTKTFSIALDPRPAFFLELHTRIIGDLPRVLIREELHGYLVKNDIAFREVWVSPESEQAKYLLLGRELDRG